MKLKLALLKTFMQGGNLTPAVLFYFLGKPTR
jgi:hypothetical protein